MSDLTASSQQYIGGSGQCSKAQKINQSLEVIHIGKEDVKLYPQMA